MERIKEAVERARQQRGESQPAAPAQAAAMPGGEAGNITYHTTRTVDTSPAVLWQHRIISSAAPEAFCNAFKMLRTQVLQRMDENDWKSLAITSAAEGEGKTVTAINLAISLAMEVQRTVLLVDANLRHPGVHSCFGLASAPGLSDYLEHDTPLEELLLKPAGIDSLVILPGGHPVANSSELLSSPKMLRLVDELKSRYPQRLVVVDLPAVLTASDALAFAPFVDAALLVIQEGKENADDVQHAAALLETTNLLGTVLNRAWTGTHG